MNELDPSKNDILMIPRRYIKSYGDINRFQREIIVKKLQGDRKLPNHVIKEVIKKMEGFRKDEFRSITVIFNRIDLLCVYGCISVSLEEI